MKSKKRMLGSFSPKNYFGLSPEDGEFSPNKMLMDFLNFDIDSIDLKGLNEKFIGLSFDSIAQAKELQAEIEGDLLPIIAPAKMPSPTEAYELIVGLVKKINGMNLRAMWTVTPIDYDFYWYDKDLKTGKRILRSQRKPQLATITVGTKLKLLDSRWIVHVNPELVPLWSLRDYFYVVILGALENGELSRFRRCAFEECQKFFITEDLKRKTCSNECGDAVDRKRASKTRVPQYRQRDLEKKKIEAGRAVEREAFKLFSEFMKLAIKSKHNNQELSKLRPVLKDLGQGDIRKGWRVVSEWQRKLKEGASLKDIWDDLPQKTKQIFETA